MSKTATKPEGKFRFRLVGAAHQCGSVNEVVNYKRGDVLASDMPLDEIFRGKFVRLSENDPDYNNLATPTPVYVVEPSETRGL